MHLHQTAPIVDFSSPNENEKGNRGEERNGGVLGIYLVAREQVMLAHTLTWGAEDLVLADGSRSTCPRIELTGLGLFIADIYLFQSRPV